MGRQRRRLIVLASLLPTILGGPPSDLAADLPVAVQEQLATVTDYQLNFDQPGVYALLAHLQQTDAPPGRYEVLSSETIPDLLSRPGDFRGAAVEVRGVVGRNSSWQRQTGIASGRPVWQLELQVAGSPVAVTALLTESATDIPLGAEIALRGYFALVREYYDTRHRRRPAILLVGHAPDEIGVRTVRAAPPPKATWPGWLILATGSLALVWIWVRRWARRPLQAERPQPRPPAQNLSKEFEAWAREDDDGQTS